MAGEVYLTRAGFQKLMDELEQLKGPERRKIAKAIAEARAQGDLSENAEYDAAKEAQAHNETRLAELEGVLSNARVIEDQNIPGDKVYIGAIVTVKDQNSDEEIQYQLVSPEEADVDENKISIFAPIGKSFVGKAEGEEVEVEVPAGKLHYKILKIERP